MTDHSPPDENTLALPDSWLARLHPRRGGLPAPVAEVDTSAAEKVAAAIDGSVPDRPSDLDRKYAVKARAYLGGDQNFAERARAYLDGTADPVGAAVVAILAQPGRGLWEFWWLPEHIHVDMWVAAHGLSFAARAFAEACIMHFGYPERDLEYLQKFNDYPALCTAVHLGHRLRGLLAVAGDEEYEEVVESLADHRRTPLQRIAVSYLVPTRDDWVRECCAAPLSKGGEEYFWWMLLCALGSQDHLDLLAAEVPNRELPHQPSMIATLMDGLGPAATPLLDAGLGWSFHDHRSRMANLEALALMPSDEAFDLLVGLSGDQRPVPPMLLGAMERFPARALRRLGAAARSSTHSAKTAQITWELLYAHVAGRPELVDRMAGDLPDHVVALHRSIQQVKEAPAAALPERLVTPPWELPRKSRAAGPATVKGLTVPAETAIVWAPGEQQAWTDHTARDDWSHAKWANLVAEYQAGQIPAYCDLWWLFADGPYDLVRPLLPDWKPTHAEKDLRPVVARYELDALPLVLRVAGSQPVKHGELVLPFLDKGTALLAARWLTTPKSARGTANAWFDRHGLAAVPFLVPSALGGHTTAQDALRMLAGRHGAPAVVAAAGPNGERVATATEALLAQDPLDILPATIPKPGAWADPALLPRVLLRDREHVLPLPVTRHLITMLAMCEHERVYAGLDAMKTVCDPDSLADFGWALFRWWQLNGAPSKDGWALTQLREIGDDRTVRRLAPIIRDWPGNGGHKLAEKGLDVLATIGTEAALRHLHGIATKIRFKKLKEHARARVESIAADLGLSAEQLGDRLVPDFGLDASGGLSLDYGPRRFSVGFDEQLKPHVVDESGKLRRTLPRPGAKDDPDLAPAAYKRFTELKKDVRALATEQIGRLETAMLDRRRWTATEFETHLAGHPLVRHIARRLVWLAEDTGTGTVTAFRIAEDRTYADVQDGPYALPESAEIRIPHPVELGHESLAAWGEVLADYEILQPFPQLGRTVHTLTEAERRAYRLERFEGIVVPTGAVVGLERRGWRRGEPERFGYQTDITRPVSGGYVMLGLEPGIAAGMIEDTPEQTLEYVRLIDHREGQAHARFGGLDPLTASEVLARLTELADAAR